MTGDLIINGKDAFITWGVRMGDGFLDAIDGFNEMKDYIENESRIEHGKRMITDNARVASREIALQFTIEGSSESDYRTKKKAFQAELEKGTVKINVPSLGNEVYKLVYLGKSLSYGMNSARCFGKVSSKFCEPNPTDRSE
jgi:hypothetical protein